MNKVTSIRKERVVPIKFYGPTGDGWYAIDGKYVFLSKKEHWDLMMQWMTEAAHKGETEVYGPDLHPANW
jgi:hypothetical protein